MGLLDTFKRASANKPTKASQAAAAPDAVAAARTRARRRLIGATVLLGMGVIGFPLLFETQPRPVPVDIPIEIPSKDKLPPLVLAPATAASAELGSAPAPAASAPPMLTERAQDQGREVPPLAAEPAPLATAVPVSPAEQARAAAAKADAAKPADTKSRDDDGARARALLEGKPAPAAESSRLVVQVGAYTESDKLRDVRARLEKMGLSTYTQVVDVKGTRHTRVRVGPFSSRAEADKAAARIKAAGLPVAVLTL